MHYKVVSAPLDRYELDLLKELLWLLANLSYDHAIAYFFGANRVVHQIYLIASSYQS